MDFIMNTPRLRAQNPARVRMPPGQVRHPEYDYRFSDWVRIRDCVEGERTIKAAGRAYLPMREGQDSEDYSLYVERAVFYNAVGRTLEGLYGSVFRRPSRVEAPKALRQTVDVCTRDGRSFQGLVEDVVAEQLEVGRVGVLVDTYDDPVKAKERGPYAVVYQAENIVHWVVEDEVLVAVLLLEYESKDPLAMFKANDQETWRLLALDENGEYYQAADKDLRYLINSYPASRRVYPEIAGVRMKRIPFTIINTDYVGPQVRKPPLLDITELNLAHYKASAVLENALYYQGTPIFWIKGPGQDGTFNPTVGPKVVWLLDKDDEVGITSFDGSMQGLENSVETKEAQIQSLGGKLIGQRKNAAARSAVSEDVSIQGEEAILLKIVKTASEGLTQVLRNLATFMRTDALECNVVVNEQFYRPKIGARELRSLISLFDAGLLPTEAAFEQLREAGFLGPDVTYEMFKSTADEAKRVREFASATGANKGGPVYVPKAPPAPSPAAAPVVTQK